MVAQNQTEWGGINPKTFRYNVYNPLTKQYIRLDGQDFTHDKFFAWEGTDAQRVQMMERFPMPLDTNWRKRVLPRKKRS